MANTINAEALKAWRQKRGWTQKQLAERLKCSPDQVSRWERGKSQNVHSHLREALIKAFGVEWEELTIPPKDSGKSADNIFDVQLNVRVSHSQRTALQLVSAYYRVPTACVVGLAPLLFLIIAEKSLAARQEAVSVIANMLENAESGGNKTARHLRSDLGVAYVHAEDALRMEESSIRKRDLFGDLVELQYVADPEGEGLNPFANYLEKLVGEIPEGMVTDLSSNWGSEHIHFTILEDVFRQILGPIAEGDSDDQANIAVNQVLNGNISLRETMAKRKALSDSEFRDWLLAESQKVLEEGPFARLLQGLVAGREAES